MLHHLLYKDPAFALELSVAAVDDTQDTLPQCLLHLSHEAADLVDQLGLDVVSETAVRLGAGVAVELRVEGVSAQNLLKRALELIGEQLKQLLLDAAQYLAELETNIPVDSAKACT